MKLPSQRKTRWLANMQAAGVESDEATIERAEPGLAERLSDLERILDRFVVHSSNPDYLRSRNEMEARDDRS